MTNLQWPPSVVEIGDRIAALTLAESAFLSKYLEEIHGLAPVGSSVVLQDVQPSFVVDQGHVVAFEYDVILESFEPAKKISIIRELRLATGLGLKEAKDLSEAAPCAVKSKLPRKEADA